MGRKTFNIPLFISACRLGKLDVVKQLLADKCLLNDAVKAINHGLKIACEIGEFEIVKYLLTSPDLNNIVDIHVDNDRCLRFIALNNYDEIIKFFVFDMDIKKTVGVKNVVRDFPEVGRFFKIREAKEKLENSLMVGRCGEDKNKRVKV